MKVDAQDAAHPAAECDWGGKCWLPGVTERAGLWLCGDHAREHDLFDQGGYA